MAEPIPPADFVAALLSLRQVPQQPDLAYREVMPPPRLAEFSAAIAVSTVADEDEQPLASSTFVVLYDPTQSELWGSDFRLVGHLRAQIDAEMSLDPLLTEAVWVSLLDNLEEATEGFSHPLGTVTKELSQTYGGLQLRGSVLNIELRCSWSANSPDVGAHLTAWGNFVLQTAGLPTEYPHGLEVRNG